MTDGLTEEELEALKLPKVRATHAQAKQALEIISRATDVCEAGRIWRKEMGILWITLQYPPRVLKAYRNLPR